MSRRVFLLAIVAALLSTVLVGWYILSARNTSPGAPSVTHNIPSPSAAPETPPTELMAAVSGAASSTAPRSTLAVPPEPSPAELAAATLELRATLVNIICLAPPTSGIRPISASGVIVSPNGYVLTNAHVAQHFLLSARGVTCKLRTGDPAQVAYEAGLAYLPPQWMADNLGVLTDPAPSGTGERDFALLAITASATSAPLPPRFPFVTLAYRATGVATPVVIGAYGAQDLSIEQIVTALSPTIVARSVKALYTYGTSSPDLLALGGSAAAQEGSSGGGVLGLDGTLRGCITMSTNTGALSTRSLSAISATYIRREYRAETGADVDILLATPTGVAVAAFAPQARALEAWVLSTLPTR